MPSKAGTISDLVSKGVAAQRGTVDLSAWQSDKLMDQWKTLKQAFEACGQSMGTNVDLALLHRVLSYGNSSFTKQKAKTLYSTVDKNGDGTVSWSELIRFIFKGDEYWDLATQVEIIKFDVIVHLFPPPPGLPGPVMTWTDSSVSFDAHSGSAERYDFPHGVVTGGVDIPFLQSAAMQKAVEEVLTSLIMKNENVMILAYGDAESRSQVVYGDELAEGTLLKAWQRIEKMMELSQDMSESTGTTIVAVSALEFSDGQCFDVFCESSPVTVLESGLPEGFTYRRIKESDELKVYLNELSKRSAQKSADGVYCHYALTLTLFCAGVDEFGDVFLPGDELCMIKSFTAVDMVHAESQQLAADTEMLKSEAQKARSSTRRNPYKPPSKKSGASDFVRFLSSSFAGEAKLFVALCLGHSPERNRADCSLASLLMKPEVAICKRDFGLLEKALKLAVKENDKAAKAFASTSRDGPKAAKWPQRRCQARSAATVLEFVQFLQEGLRSQRK
eukprot:TRINITY_DN106362_c0_g1_i1.p1 TRINITY_DN106362_c0_g1~~TRINITY_DN106362_c0_g1_i1.p1  ORF type:complete len:523 (+),score=106.61 TRINITY_DN106362_c0_g1_i1:62-1570(+)